MTPWADVAETHTAAVFFAGDRAVKVKKPCRFDFVDLSTRAARLVACEREVVLNRRLAPDVYLGVGTVRLPGGGDEPAVVMRRLPAGRRLSTLVERRAPGVEPAVTEVARQLAAFHERQPARTDIDLAVALARWWEGVAAVPGAGPEVADAMRTCHRLAGRYLAGRGRLLADRVAAGRVRDGHGDLLADDVFMLPDGPRLLDCLEFDDDLRVADVVLDVAFLAMDLERLDAAALARRLLDAYREFTAETHPASYEHFAVAYRAAVRAKVAVLRAAQGSAEAAADAPALLALAHRHLRAATVTLVLVGGLPGTGKTTTARAVARDADLLVVATDEVRRELLPAGGGAPAWRQGRYAPGAVDRVYAEVLARARTALERGQSVLVDASWSAGRHRDLARALAAGTSAVLVEVECAVPDDVAAARLAARVGDASEATVDVRAHMSTAFEPWPEAARVYGDAATAPAEVRALLEASVGAAGAG